jgi:hypothetical protein
LLQFFPAEFRRDRCWAIQALQVAETWNGHAFVQPLAALAESITIQLALVVYPASLRSEFNEKFGIQGGVEAEGKNWETGVFVEANAWPKKKPSDLVPAWIAKQKADAVLIIVGSGQPVIRTWSAGKESGGDPATLGLGRAPSGEECSRAGQTLDAGILLAALGQSDLLKPPVLDPAARAANGNKRPDAIKTLEAEAPLISSPAGIGRLAEARVPQFPRPSGTPRLVCVEAAGLLSPEIVARELAAHLGKGVDVWIENDRIYVCTESAPEWPLLAGLFGDVPCDASVKVATTDGFGFQVVQS